VYHDIEYTGINASITAMLVYTNMAVTLLLVLDLVLLVLQ